MEYPPVLALIFCWLIVSCALSVLVDAVGGWAFDRRNPFEESR